MIKPVKNMQLNSLEETEKLAKQVAASLKPGQVLAFYGDLGAGKTTFIQYLCKELGLSEQITSPTFTIINEYYSGKAFPVFHFDFYRLKNTTELKVLNFDDYIYGEGVCLIEWAEKIELFLPEEYYKIKLWFDENDKRTISIEAIK